MDIAIHYNAERGFEEPALLFARRLFAQYDEAITSLALVPESTDDLAIYLNGRLVHSASETGRLPKLADIDAVPSPPNPTAQRAPGPWGTGEGGFVPGRGRAPFSPPRGEKDRG